MAALYLDGYPVLSATISSPEVGAWFAEVQIAGDVSLSSSVNLGGWVGSIAIGGPFAGRGHYRIAGGAGGLGSVLNPRHHRGATVSRVLGDICSDAGERKSGLILPTIATQSLPYWSRGTGTGGAAMRQLADHLGAIWRILPTGEVWIGDRGTAYAPPAEFQVLDRDPMDSSYDIAPDSLALWAGHTQEAGLIRRIEYSVGDNIRARYWV